MKRALTYPLIALMFLTVTSCRVTKDKSEMGWFGRNWHDMNSRWNGYYNADVIFQESQASLEDQYIENYTQVLPVYPSISIDNPESEIEQLDRAIQKVAVITNLHPGSKWIDDCYVMMGKTQYLKQDFESAEETLKYFQENFNPTDPDSRMFNANTKKDPNEKRRDELKEERKIREIERKSEEEARKEDNKLKEKLKEAEQQVKEKVRDVKEDKRAFERKRKEDYDKLRKNLRDAEAKRKELFDKDERNLRDDIKKLKERLRKVSQKERENERDKRIEERKKAAEKNTRSTRRKKGEKSDQTKTQTAPTITAADQLQNEIDQKEAQLESLKETYSKSEVAQDAADDKALEEYKLATEDLSKKYDEQAKEITGADEKKKEEDERLRKEKELAAEEAAKLAEEEEAEKQKDDIKTRDNIGKGGIFGHSPAYAEGLYWLGMTYIERQNYFLSEYIFRVLSEEYEIPKEISRRIPAAKAHLFMKQNKLDQAVPELEQAMDQSERRSDRARFAYILAQIQEQKGDYASSVKAFERAKNLSPDYEMEFHAELAMLRNSWSAGLSTMDNVQKKLNRLTKDEKNYEYLDQVFYTKAEMKLAVGDAAGAMEDFQEATKYGSTNPQRQAESFYRLANLFYSVDDYVNAKLYFDSTLTVMPEKDERFGDVSRLNENLTSIADHAATVALQDSLLALGNLSKDQLQDWANQKYEENAVEEESTKDNNEPLIQKPNRTIVSKPSNSSFFAYNTLVLQKGKFDFNRKWGDRPPQDNWRRTEAITTFLPEENIEVIAEEEVDVEKDAAIEEMLRDIPTTANQKQIATEKLKTAMFNLGTDLRNNLSNYEKSNDVLSDYVKRFPASDDLLKVYYYLYLNNVDLNNQSAANVYLSLIRTEFPESDLAKSLVDPNYADKLNSQKEELNDYYELTYATFDANNYAEAHKLATESKAKFGDNNEYAVKFDLLSVMSKGAMDGEPFYIIGLRDFIKRHPNTPETTRANEILRFLKGDQEAFDNKVSQEALGKFQLQEEKLHYVIYVMYETSIEGMREAKQQLANYNNKFHKLSKLRISNTYLNTENKTQLILVRSFQNKTKTDDYLEIAERNIADFIDADQFSYELFAITQNNYREIMKQKTIKNYESFYNIHYRIN